MRGFRHGGGAKWLQSNASHARLTSSQYQSGYSMLELYWSVLRDVKAAFHQAS